MDVTFREFEPYYTNKCDLEQFLKKFSLVNESDSREGENSYMHSGDDTQERVITGGTISSPQDEMVTRERTSGGSYEVDSDDIESNEVQEDNKVMEDNEVEVVETIPCPTDCIGENRGRRENVDGQNFVEKQPIVYQRRRFKNQGEQVEQPQPQQTPPPILNLTSDPSPSSSLTLTGNVSPNLDHIGLSLAQRREPPRLGFENDIANFIGYSRVSTTYRTFIASLQTVSIPKD
jgi:hypothetical protein